MAACVAISVPLGVAVDRFGGRGAVGMLEARGALGARASEPVLAGLCAQGDVARVSSRSDGVGDKGSPTLPRRVAALAPPAVAPLELLYAMIGGESRARHETCRTSDNHPPAAPAASPAAGQPPLPAHSRMHALPAH